MFAFNDVVMNIRTGEVIQFIHTPASGLCFSGTKEPAYLYNSLTTRRPELGSQRIEVIAASEIENGDYVKLAGGALGEAILEDLNRIPNEV